MWQRRTTLEKVLITFYLLVGAVAVTSLVAYVIIKHDAGKHHIRDNNAIVWMKKLKDPNNLFN